MKVYPTLILFFLTAMFSSCGNNQEIIETKPVEVIEFSERRNLSEFETTEFIPTLENKISTKKNAIYSASLLFAWDQIRKQINQSFEIPNEHAELKLLNSSDSYRGVLKENEYNAIGQIDGDLMTARAEFHIALPFETKLQSYTNELEFNGQKVKSFGIHGDDERELLNIVNILYYKNDDNFILLLHPKDPNHEIVIFKSEKRFKNIAEMQKEIERLSEIGRQEKAIEKSSWKYYYNDQDIVVIPKFNFNIETNYESIEGNTISTQSSVYQILEVWQQIGFILDESGASVQSEAEIMLALEDEELPKPKKMVLDKPFLVTLKRVEAKYPYFGMWVVNSELMIPE